MSMPRVYRPPLMLPLRWQDEQSGVLPAAVMAFHGQMLGCATITDEQTELVRSYVEYYVNAPCWDDESFDAEILARLAEIRRLIKSALHAHQIADVIHDCLKIGLDPL